MLKRFALAAAVLAVAGLLPSHGVAAPVAATRAAIVAQPLPPLFDTKSVAQAHCPKDVVVWLNIPSGIYPYEAERWYGARSTAAMHARKAIAAGDRASEAIDVTY
ncbi:MAG: hypothetical protein WB681_05255 [Candidatus Cybelea sp.]